MLQPATSGGVVGGAAHPYRTMLVRARMEQDLEDRRRRFSAGIDAEGSPHGLGFEVAAASSPCRAIGGDFLDYFALPTGAFGFVLGDVSGKAPRGVACRQTSGLLARLLQLDAPPSQTFDACNQELRPPHTVGTQEVPQLSYAVCCSCDGRLTYSNADVHHATSARRSAIK